MKNKFKLSQSTVITARYWFTRSVQGLLVCAFVNSSVYATAIENGETDVIQKRIQSTRAQPNSSVLESLKIAANGAQTFSRGSERFQRPQNRMWPPHCGTEFVPVDCVYCKNPTNGVIEPASLSGCGRMGGTVLVHCLNNDSVSRDPIPETECEKLAGKPLSTHLHCQVQNGRISPVPILIKRCFSMGGRALIPIQPSR